MKSIELFAGAGGLALGVADAGFAHDAVVELNNDSCNTIRENARLGVKPVTSWPLFQANVQEFDFSPYAGVDLVAGGPHCPKPSPGGIARGHVDAQSTSRGCAPRAAERPTSSSHRIPRGKTG